MRIATINASVTGGGAEFVARTLHEAYLARGLEAWLLVGNRNAEAPNVIEIPNERFRSAWARGVRRPAAAAARRSRRNRDLWWYADRALRMLGEPARYAAVARGHEDFDQPATHHLLELTPDPPEILHFHNLHGSYFDVRELPELTRQKASVITLHDTWLFTGHCAHPLECGRWLTGCETCPHLDRYVPLMNDASAANAALKRRSLQESRLAYAAPSRWMLDFAERRGALSEALDARVIPNGIDTSIFAPGDRTAARSLLGLPPSTLTLVCAARDLVDNPYKGFDVLEAACSILADQGVSAVVLALGSPGATRRIGAIELRFVPHIDDPATLATYYRAGDIYVHPARAEVLGLTIIEAMACGLPLVASDVGGIPDVVAHGTNGLLVRPGDPQDLARSLAVLLGDSEARTRLGAQGARLASARYTLGTQAEAYLEYYEDVIRSHRTRTEVTS